MTKQRILERRDPIDVESLFDNRTFDDVILELHSMYREYEPEILGKDKEVKFETSPYGYDGGLDVVVNVMRWESDKEYATRQGQELAMKDRARKAKETKKAKALAQALTTEADERELLAKLQAKYGAKV